MKAAIFAFGVMACAAFPAYAGEPNVELEMTSPRASQGLRQCTIFFKSGVPSKKSVDDIMSAAMDFCRRVDSTHDIQVMATQGEDGDPLPDGRETRAWLAYHSKTNKIDGPLDGHQWDDVKP